MGERKKAGMKTFIDTGKIDILCRNYGSKSVDEKRNSYTTYEEVHEEMKNQQSGWEKFKSRVKGIWEKAKPIISGLTTFLTVATAFLKALIKFGTQCKNMKANFACNG